jgi:hypothetical protein
VVADLVNIINNPSVYEKPRRHGSLWDRHHRVRTGQAQPVRTGTDHGVDLLHRRLQHRIWLPRHRWR